MCLAVIGGMDRLQRHYREEADRTGVELRIFNRSEANLAAKLNNVDALVIFTNKISHRARNEAVTVARRKEIPVFMYHSCGVCTLRNCLNCLMTIHEEE
jgi:hypothetical protein